MQTSLADFQHDRVSWLQRKIREHNALSVSLAEINPDSRMGGRAGVPTQSQQYGMFVRQMTIVEMQVFHFAQQILHFRGVPVDIDQPLGGV